jgi:hypothetical protein
MSYLMSPLFLLLRNLTLFRHPTLTFFRSLMPCLSPLDLVFVLVFVQEHALLMSVLHLRLHSSLALLRALGLSPHLPHWRLWSAPLLTRVAQSGRFRQHRTQRALARIGQAGGRWAQHRVARSGRFRQHRT